LAIGVSSSSTLRETDDSATPAEKSPRAPAASDGRTRIEHPSCEYSRAAAQELVRGRARAPARRLVNPRLESIAAVFRRSPCLSGRRVERIAVT